LHYFRVADTLFKMCPDYKISLTVQKTRKLFR